MSKPPPPGRIGNRLLDRLSPATVDRLLTSAKVVNVPLGETVLHQGRAIDYVYFPTTGMYSVVITTQDGARTEAATVGSEGMVGLPLHFGLDFSIHTAILQVPGEAIRIRASIFSRLVESDPDFHRLMQRYAAFSLRYANQTVACNVLHSIQQRASRWLLMTRDRVSRDEFTLTHEFLAEMLGVRRQSVSLVAGALQRSGLITYHRGVVRVLDSPGLEATSCECYKVLRSLYREILG